MNVLITGANRGIGLGFVRHYLDAGHRVWACYRSAAGQLADIEDDGLQRVQWDVTEDQPASFPAAAGLPPHLDLLINNAGVWGGDAQALEQVSARTMLETFDINCVGALRVTQLLWPALAQAGGVIANMSSKMGSTADNSSGGYYAYRASKAALVIVSRSMAVDLRRHGIHVITLHPGWVRTDMTDHSGLLDVDESVTGLARVIANARDYEPGAFIAYDGRIVPY